MNDKYILQGHKVVLEPDLLKWDKWFETANRLVARTIENNIRISTVFLGLDHSFGRGRPLLFETMVFGDPCDGDMKRYETWEDAEMGHKAMVRRVMGG